MSVYELRTARRQYQCTERSYHTIKIGDVYLFGCMTPCQKMARGKKFGHIRACVRCAKEFGMLDSDMRKLLEGTSA